MRKCKKQNKTKTVKPFLFKYIRCGEAKQIQYPQDFGEVTSWTEA